MKALARTSFLSLITATAIGLGIHPSAQAQGGFHFPVGITYSLGAQDAMDTLLDAYEADWKADYGQITIEDRFIIPIGLSFSPYYEWNNGFGVGLSLGPTAFAFGIDDVGSNDKFSYMIPVGADIRYTFMRDRPVAPYVRAGVRYPIAGGDNIDSSQVGGFGAVGLEFWRTKKIGMGLEVGYDSSKLKIVGANGSKDVIFAGLTVSLSILF